jgi:hypothetical protein
MGFKIMSPNDSWGWVVFQISRNHFLKILDQYFLALTNLKYVASTLFQFKLKTILSFKTKFLSKNNSKQTLCRAFAFMTTTTSTAATTTIIEFLTASYRLSLV